MPTRRHGLPDLGMPAVTLQVSRISLRLGGIPCMRINARAVCASQELWLLRIGTVLLLSTFLDDGFRELSGFGEQIRYLDSPRNNIRLPYLLAALYVAASLSIQLVGGAYISVCSLLNPEALIQPAAQPASGPWRHAGPVLTCLATFVLSSLIIYGFGQPASEHAQGRAVFLLRNAGILGGVLLLVSTHQGTAKRRGMVGLASR